MFTQVHADRLLRLAEHLGGKPIPGFDMCGWNSCALHESPKIFGGSWFYNTKNYPHYEVDTGNPHDSAEKFFGLEPSETLELFSSMYNKQVSQHQKAEHIRQFVAKKLAVMGARLVINQVEEVVGV